MPPRWRGQQRPALSGKRVDPADGKAYSFDEAVAAYKGQYSQAQIRSYWENEMRQVDGSGDAEAVDAGSHQEGSSTQAGADAGGASGSSAPAAQAAPGSQPAQAGQLRVSFCPDPKSIGEKFTLTYDRAPQANFASVNPGDQGLKVGGGTLNGQFQKDLYNFGWQETERYGPYHNKLFAGAAPQKLARATPDVLASNPNLLAGFVLKAGDGGKVGTAFVDIFRSEACVHKDARNLGMVYTVGPKRQDCPNDQAFLAQVEATAQNVCLACTQYNALAGAEGLPRLEVLRMPLVSGGAFAGKCPKDAVAAALVRGLVAACGADTPELNFAFDGDIFKRTWSGISAGAA